MLFFVQEDRLQEVAGSVIANLFAMLHAVAVNWQGDVFELHIAFENFLNCLANIELSEILEVR